MQATVTKSFSGAPDGEHYPVKFAVGDEVYGELANVAIESGWAVLPDADVGNAAGVDVAAVNDDIAEAVEDDEPVKRKRGRPRNVY